MKVTISVFGRFHAFNLAHQVYQKKHLHKLITSYPKFEVKKYGIPRKKICSLIQYEVLKRGYSKIGKWVGNTEWIDRFLKNRFECAAAQQITVKPDIFVAWSGTAEEGLKRAKDLGATVVLERGSSHIIHQREVLKRESEEFGIKINLPSKRLVEKNIREYDLADAISIPSKFVERSFINQGVDSSKLIRVPYGVEIEEFPQLKKKDDVFRVVYAGQMSLRKGVQYLLRAFSELDLPNSELWLLGSKKSNIDPFFRKYEGSFEYLGHKPQSELHKFYSQGSVFVICSIEEGLAMVQPQAMACGLPLICTSHTGGEDLIREGEEGFVLPPRNVDELKEKILWLYENPDERRRMGENARNRVLNHFQWSDYGDRVIREYRKLVE